MWVGGRIRSLWIGISTVLYARTILCECIGWIHSARWWPWIRSANSRQRRQTSQRHCQRHAVYRPPCGRLHRLDHRLPWLLCLRSRLVRSVENITNGMVMGDTPSTYACDERPSETSSTWRFALWCTSSGTSLPVFWNPSDYCCPWDAHRPRYLIVAMHLDSSLTIFHKSPITLGMGIKLPWS